MLKYKIDVLNELKKRGYNSTMIYKTRIIPQTAVQKIRKGQVVGIATLDRLCELLDMDPGDIIEWMPEAKTVYVLEELTMQVNRKDRKIIKPGCTDDVDASTREIARYDSEETALIAAKNFESFVKDLGSVYMVTEYLVEEVELNEDGDEVEWNGSCEGFREDWVMEDGRFYFISDLAEKIADELKEQNEVSGYWEPETARRLCELAGMLIDYERAKGIEGADVVFKAAEKLGVEI